MRPGKPRAGKRPKPGGWANSGLCSTLPADPDIFHSKDPHKQATAKAMCAKCPVIVPCLTHALDWHENQGVWGGLTARERKTVSRTGMDLDEALRFYLGSRTGARLMQALRDAG